MKIGIFIAYPPKSELSNQGLGRLLRSIVAGINESESGQVVLLCPSWLQEDVRNLFHGFPSDRFQVISKSKIPLIVRLWERFFARRTKTKKSGRLTRLKAALSRLLTKLVMAVGRSFVWMMSSDNDFWFLASSVILLTIAATLAPVALLAALGIAVVYTTARFAIAHRVQQRLAAFRSRARKAIERKVGSFLQRKLPPFGQIVLREVTRRESLYLVRRANSMTDVDVWYSPTVFWPEFNEIRASRVQAFPDMLISQFPTAFALTIKDAPYIYKRAKEAIAGGIYFTAYSTLTAERDLSGQFSIPLDRISVIPHAAMDLAPHISIKGTLDDKYARDQFAKNLIDGYRLTSWQNNEYLSNIDLKDVSFILYASQFRPNKNILNLVKGYEIALRKKFVYSKLILTGNISHAPDVEAYIKEHRLQYDVLFAYDVPDQVLAALYARASLVVNPTLYEGGFPFTFSEGMSVGTPSIMSRIPQVTELVSSDLAGVMLFNPLAPEDIAAKIAWGLKNRDRLRELQTPLYNEMRNRSWSDVGRDHVNLFRRIIAAA
ncbi:glycosyltransferase [Mesorhizobium sp. M1A.F.Ca.ET.072.01.1.1]|uniref:glycosyltransferase n=1 Tax=Mesorhizobium sp. M1A.F.Ca.ET.072.01.1.1 TaxID=2496753 RepID=UPI000FD446AC|nr:glycosyltransferase [Mesorhizobium sp. M1A.F.Ca.ET.072.01.1.1]RUW55248.1 glycosyltransferase [Mesorhizobium sp. M1A.F.Ca.ET.072.01.1.1]TIV03115.1 MAG: glycosyltransferase family 4 protein [Mesorhizobium sp.]